MGGGSGLGIYNRKINFIKSYKGLEVVGRHNRLRPEGTRHGKRKKNSYISQRDTVRLLFRTRV